MTTINFNTDRLSHAYITDEAYADTLAMAVVCGAHDGGRPCRCCVHCDKASRHIHPDIAVVGKLEDKLIVTVDQVRELKKDVYVIPNEADKKAYIINDADKMNMNAQNAILRILEEPPSFAVFILCTENPAALLPTVRSRCVELKSRAVIESDGDTIAEPVGDRSDLEGIASDFITALGGDNVKLMECMFRLDKLNRQDFSVFLDLARDKVVLSLRGDPSLKRLVQSEGVLSKAGEMLDLNVSAGHISGMICASLLACHT